MWGGGAEAMPSEEEGKEGGAKLREMSEILSRTEGRSPLLKSALRSDQTIKC